MSTYTVPFMDSPAFLTDFEWHHLMGELGSMSTGFPNQQRVFCQDDYIQEQQQPQVSYVPNNNQYPMPAGTYYQPSPPEMPMQSPSEWNYYGSPRPLYLRITEEPIGKIRFRYRSERGSHGSMSGRNSTNTQRTWPTVQLVNLTGGENNGVKVRASLYTDDKVKPHVHTLLGKNCNSEIGDCTLPLQPDMTCSFPSLGVLFTEKKKVQEVLLKRKIDECRGNVTEEMHKQFTEEAKQEAKEMKLNSIRICFQALNGNNEPITEPVFSEPVHNLKSPDSGELKITRLSRCTSSSDGGEEVFLLCEKVNKKDIKVKFFKLNEEGQEIWTDFGKFADSDVHHQVAIVFRTPPYYERNIEKPVKVCVQLYRQNDGETSESLDFTYKPRDKDPDLIHHKRRRLNEPDNDYKDFGGHPDFSGHQPNQFGPPGPGHTGHWPDGSSNSGQGDYPMMPQHGHTYQGNQMAMFFEQFGQELRMSSSSPSSSQDSQSLSSHSEAEGTSQFIPVTIPPLQHLTLSDKPVIASSCTSALDPTVPPTDFIGQEHDPHQPFAELDGTAVNRQLYGEMDLGIVGQMATKSNFPLSVAKRPTRSDIVAQGDYAHFLPVRGNRLVHSFTKTKDSGEDRIVPVGISEEVVDSPALGTSVKKVSKEKSPVHNRRRGSIVKPERKEVKQEPGRRKSEPSRTDTYPKQEVAKSEMPKLEVLKSDVPKPEGAKIPIASNLPVQPRSKSTIENFVKKQIIPRFGRSLRYFTSTGNVQYLLWSLAPFLASQNDDGDNSVHLAVIHQSTNKSLFEQLIPVVSSMMPYDVINHTNNLYQTPLHLGVAVQEVDVVQWLLLSGGDPNLQDNHGNTPIHLAVLRNDHKCLAILLQKNLYRMRSQRQPLPNSDILNFDGFSALHLAILKGSQNCFSLLMDSGANVNLQDGTSGRTPLHLAIETQSPLVEELLKQSSIDVDARDYAGNTALHLACSLELYELAHTLMSAEANPLAPSFVTLEDEDQSEDDEDTNEQENSRRGRTPMDIANGNEKLLSILSGQLSKADSKELRQARRKSRDELSKSAVAATQLPGDSCSPRNPSADPQDSTGDTKTKEEQADSGICSGLGSTSLEEDEFAVSGLCSLLDPPSTNWEKLAAIVFEKHSTVDTIRKLEKSPTLFLCKEIKKQGMFLQEALNAAGLSDVWQQLSDSEQKAVIDFFSISPVNTGCRNVLNEYQPILNTK